MYRIKLRISGLEEGLEDLQRQVEEFTRKYHGRRVPLADASAFIAGIKADLTGLPLTREEAEAVGNEVGLEAMKALTARCKVEGPYPPEELPEIWKGMNRMIDALFLRHKEKEELKDKAWAALIRPIQWRDPDLWWMVKIIFAEASGEPYEGKLAVGWVVRNRLERNDPRWFGSGSYHLIITYINPIGKEQFRGIHNEQWGKAERYWDMPNEKDGETLMLCIKAAYAVEGGTATDPSHGAEYFHEVSERQEWILKYANHKPPKIRKTATIGKHVFWRLTDYYWAGRPDWKGIPGAREKAPNLEGRSTSSITGQRVRIG